MAALNVGWHRPERANQYNSIFTVCSMRKFSLAQKLKVFVRHRMADYFSSEKFLEQFEQLFHPDCRYSTNEMTIDHLRDLFERHPINDKSTATDICSATQGLLNYVMYATNQSDCWGESFHICLDMMFEYNQVKDIDGSFIEYVCFPYQFDSHCAPDRAVLRPFMEKFSVDIAKRINRDLQLSCDKPIDAIREWLLTREKPLTDLYPLADKASRLSGSDPHEAFVSEFLRVDKRAGLLDALSHGRARRQRNLDFQLLREFSDRIHSSPEGTAHFRTSRAYAKEGCEFYESNGQVFRQFTTLLAEEEDDFTIKAAKTYLDICFFHPFEDGNGRLAEVVFEFIIKRNSYRLINAEAGKALFRSSRWSNDPYVLRNLVNLIRSVIVRNE